MKKQTAQLQNPQGTPPTVTIRAEDFREGYANSVNIEVNVWDFTLEFGRLKRTPPAVERGMPIQPAPFSIVAFQSISMSPQQAKALAGILNQHVSGYEQLFGEIRLQPIAQAPNQPQEGAPVTQ